MNNGIEKTFALPEAPVMARPKYWEKFLAGIGYLENTELTEYFEQLTLYLLTASNARHEMYFFVGDGCNGKSTYLRWLADVIGAPHVSSMPLRDLNTYFGASALLGKRLNLSTESGDKEVVATAKLKAIVTGGAIQVDRKNRDAVTVPLITKLAVETNITPIISGCSKDWLRHFRMVRFERQIPKNETIVGLSGYLLDEAPEIVAWLCWKYVSSKSLTVPDALFSEPVIVKEWSEQLLMEDCVSVA